MRLRSVHIQNFKQFEDLKVQFGAIDCLVGANNSGKTTLLQALALFDFCLRHCLHRKNGHLELRKRTIAPEDFYVLPVRSPTDIWTDRSATRGGQRRRVNVVVEFDDDNRVTVEVRLDLGRFTISVRATDDSAAALGRLAAQRIADLPVFSAFAPREEQRQAAVLDDEIERGRANGVIRNLLLELRVRGRLDALVEIMRRSFPALRKLRVEFDEVTDRYIEVTYREGERGKAFDIYSAGSGFQQFLYLIGFILLREPVVILLDEPDVHLHGSLQAVLVSELRKLAEEGKQVVFATHSRELIARVSPEHILSLDSGIARRLAAGGGTPRDRTARRNSSCYRPSGG